MENNTILPKEQYCFLWRTSWLSLFSSLYAMYRGHHNLAICPFGIWITSITFWIYPTYGWRRNLDIAYVHAAIVYHSYYAYQLQNAKQYYIVLFIAMSFFPISIYYYNQKKYWMATICHSQIHILGNLSNFILYSS